MSSDSWPSTLARSRWPSLLLPRPNPKWFMMANQTVQPTNESGYTTSSVSHNSTQSPEPKAPLVPYSSDGFKLSGTIVAYPLVEHYIPISDAPPKLKPLIFNEEPLIDLAQPPYNIWVYFHESKPSLQEIALSCIVSYVRSTALQA